MAYIPLIISLLVTQISPSVIITMDGRWEIPLSQWTCQLGYTREAHGLPCTFRTQPQWLLWCNTAAIISLFTWQAASNLSRLLWAGYRISQMREYIKIRWPFTFSMYLAQLWGSAIDLIPQAISFPSWLKEMDALAASSVEFPTTISADM